MWTGRFTESHIIISVLSVSLCMYCITIDFSRNSVQHYLVDVNVNSEIISLVF